MSSSDEEVDYEERRLKNIRQNQELLAELDLKGAADGLGLPPSRAAASAKGKGKADGEKKARPVQPRKKAVKTEATPTTSRVTRRQSARLTASAAIDPNETPAQRKKREAENARKRKREEEELEAAKELERAAKRPRHYDLDLNALGDEELNEDELSALRDLFDGPSASTSAKVNVESSSSPKRKAGKVKDEDDDDSKPDPGISALRKQLSPMVIKSRAKVTQDRVYSMAYHPDVTKDLVFVGDKHGQLGIWDARAPAEEDEDDKEQDKDAAEGGRYYRLQPHWPKSSQSSISCIRFNPFDSNEVITSAYDCTIRSTSFEKNVSTELFSLASSKILIQSFDITPSGDEFWVSDAQGGLTHVDKREGSKGSRLQVNVKEKIGCVSVNQRQPHLLLTASNDRMVQIWDARKLVAIPTFQQSDNEDEKDLRHPVFEADWDAVHEFRNTKPGRSTVLAAYQHGLSATAAYWDPSGRNIVSTSYDNHIRIWNLGSWARSSAEMDDRTFTPKSKLKHSTQTGRWVTGLRAHWSPNADVSPYFTIGNMDHTLNIFAYNGEKLAVLNGGTHVTAVQAVTASHPSIVARVASGNASGRCVLWGPRDL